MNNELRSAAGAHRRPALAAVEGRRAPPPHTGIAHINPNTRLPTAVEATAVEAAAVKAEQSGLFFPAELNDRPCRLTSLALFVLCLIVSASSILGATCTKLCNPTHSSSSRKTVRSWTPTRRFVAVVLLALVNAPLALSEFTVKDIAQQTPMAGAPNSITVSLQSSVELSGSNSSNITIFNLTGLTASSVINLTPVSGGASGHSLFCHDMVTVGTAALDNSMLQLSLCENRALIANTLYAFAFSVSNPPAEQPPPSIQISANGTSFIAPSAMLSSSSAAAGIPNGAAPLYTVQTRITLKAMGQTRPLVSVLNTLSLTLATNIDIASSANLALVLSGLAGTSQAAGSIGVRSTAGSAQKTLFCDGAQTNAGVWGTNQLTLAWCAGSASTLAANTPYVLSFNITNANTPQQSAPAISVQLAGASALPPVAVDTPGSDLIGVPSGADPLVLLAPRFLVGNMSQSTPAAGSSNELSVTFMTNVDLLSSDASQVVLSGFSGATSATARVALQDIAGGSNADQLLCAGAVVSAGAWDSILRSLSLALCPGHFAPLCP